MVDPNIFLLMMRRFAAVFALRSYDATFARTIATEPRIRPSSVGFSARVRQSLMLLLKESPVRCNRPADNETTRQSRKRLGTRTEAEKINSERIQKPPNGWLLQRRLEWARYSGEVATSTIAQSSADAGFLAEKFRISNISLSFRACAILYEYVATDGCVQFLI